METTSRSALIELDGLSCRQVDQISPDPDVKMLAVHNVESNHDIGSEFYEGQIQAEFTELSKEQRIVRAQGQFEGEVFDNRSGLKIFQLQPEAIALMAELRRPLHFTESEFGDAMEVMTKLFIKRINVAALKDNLRSVLPEKDIERFKSYGGLKTLELWLGQVLKLATAPEVMLPLFCTLRSEGRVQTSHSGGQTRGNEGKL